MDDKILTANKNAALQIVPFSKKYIPELVSLEQQCFSCPWSVGAFEAEVDNGNAHFLVALLTGTNGEAQVAGYIGVHEVCGEAYIANVAVFPEMRRKGVAGALIGSACDGARKRGCEFITLEVRESNHAAIGLYEKNGFTSRGLRKNFYDKPAESAIIMTLDF